MKGGKRFGFAALVVVGDGKGRAGFGHGKAREVPEAISKATAAAKKAMVRVPLRDGRTLHHDGNGHFGAGKVTVRSAPSGTGIIAGGPMRAVFESLGVADVVTKSVGTSNPYNMVRATFEALEGTDQPALGRPAPRQEGLRPAWPWWNAGRRSRSGRRSDRGVSIMAKIKITQTGSPIRRDKTQRATLVGLGLNKMHRTVECRSHARSDGPSAQGRASGHRRGVNSLPSRSREGLGEGLLPTCPTPTLPRKRGRDTARNKRKRVQDHETQ